MTEAQTITVTEVKAAALKAYKEGRLLAQSDCQVEYGYEVKGLDGKTRVCAIGAALTRESLDMIEAEDLQCCTIHAAMSGLCEVFDCAQADYEALCYIQNAHDAWLGWGGNDKHRKQKEAHFLGLIQP